MANKFKFYTRINPFTKRKEYQTLMMGKSDGKDITYRTSFQRSRQKARDEIARAQGSIRAAKTGERVTVKQNYGTTKAALKPNTSVSDVLKTGGKLITPDTYEELTDGNLYQKRQTRDKRGIRKGKSRSLLYANMLNPKYNRLRDVIDG